MRLVTRSNQSLLEQRREQSRRKRVAAGTLADAYPAVEQVNVTLTFNEPEGLSPVRQTHGMYPAAPAYFEFPCPHGDCDGSFDLNSAAAAVLKKSLNVGDGTLKCPGTRSGTPVARQPCTLSADYRIAVQYQPKTPAKSKPAAKAKVAAAPKGKPAPTTKAAPRTRAKARAKAG